MSVTNTDPVLQEVASVLITEAKTPFNRDANCDRANLIMDRLLARRDAEIAASALQVTIPASKANFAAVYATLTQIVDGAVFTVADSTDTTDTSLAVAKGSAPAAGDTFQRSGTAPVFVGSDDSRAAIAATMTYL